jgi:cellulose synthase/poly-beta-1,6-N-acetylglucosamine synthase-like glycosyltransferase
MISGLFLLSVVLLYSAILLWCLAAWKKGRKEYSPLQKEAESISVLIPARNESSRILHTLSFFSRVDISSTDVEIIVIDDQSEDGTVALVRQFIADHPSVNLKLIESRVTSGKKQAIELGVQAAINKIIVTTDADVQLQPNWLKELIGALQPAGLVCGPVLLKNTERRSFVGNIVALESLGLAVISASGIVQHTPFFCNGANMAFYKEDFIRLGGYRDTANEMTGDDTSLLLKYPPEKVSFAFQSDAVVIAEPTVSLSDFIRQRQRWASKVPTTLTRSTLIFAVIAWMAYVMLLWSTIACIFFQFHVLIIVIALFIKVVVEYAVLKASSNFFREHVSLIVLLVAQPIYWTAIVIIGMLAVFLPYQWKGRSSKR